jgi:hypothetical protein
MNFIPVQQWGWAGLGDNSRIGEIRGLAASVVPRGNDIDTERKPRSIDMYRLITSSL